MFRWRFRWGFFPRRSVVVFIYAVEIMVYTAIQLVLGPRRKIFSFIRSGQIPTSSASLRSAVITEQAGDCWTLSVCFFRQSNDASLAKLHSSGAARSKLITRNRRGGYSLATPLILCSLSSAEWCAINLPYQTCPHVRRVKEYSASPHQETLKRDLAPVFLLRLFHTPTVFHTHQLRSHQTISRISCSNEVPGAFSDCDSS